MNKHKVKIGILSLLLITMFASGAMAVTPVITTEGAISTGDRTPEIEFTPIGNNASYLCTLYIGNASGYETAVGTSTVENNTLGSIVCNRRLDIGTYTYNVSMYNVSESPVTTFSSDAALKITTFGVIVSMLTELTDIFTPVLTIVISVIPILIALGIAAFVIGMLTALLASIQRKL